jgi:hypothetical protein
MVRVLTDRSVASFGIVWPLAVAIRCRIVHCRINSLLRPMMLPLARRSPRILSILPEDVASFAVRSPPGLFSKPAQSCHTGRLLLILARGRDLMNQRNDTRREVLLDVRDEAIMSLDARGAMPTAR